MKSFKYGKINTSNIYKGVGEAVVDPNILTYMNSSAFCNSTTGSINSMFAREVILGLHKYRAQLFVNRDNSYWHWELEFNSANFRKLLDGRPPVIYPEVTVYYGEIDEGDNYAPEKTNGKTVYKYDIYDYQSGIYNMISVLTNSGYAFFECPKYYGNTLTYEPKSYRYNNLKEKIDYRVDGKSYKPISKEKNDWWYRYEQIKDYQYTNIYPLYAGTFPVNPPYPVNTFIHQFFDTKWTNYGTALLQSRVITSYTSTGDSLTTLEWYEYNNRNQLIWKDIANSGGKSITTVYQYPEINKNGSTPDVIRELVNQNMLTTVIEQKTETWPSGKVISGYKIDYKQFTAGILPEKLYELKDATSVLSTQVLSYQGNRPQEVVTQDGVHTVYIWREYDYPIAEIKNATLAQVNSAVQSVFGISLETLVTQFANPDVTKLKNLKNNANLSNAFVTTYTYGAWGKVTSVTDPANKTIYYNYDGFGRLKEIKDDNNKKIEDYEYNYKK